MPLDFALIYQNEVDAHTARESNSKPNEIRAKPAVEIRSVQRSNCEKFVSSEIRAVCTEKREKYVPPFRKEYRKRVPEASARKKQ